MSEDWNRRIIEEFRANGGRVGPPFEGAPLTLVHHRGRTSGRDHVSPMMYLPNEEDDAVMYVFASKAGAPDDPQWYRNLMATPKARVEVGTEQWPVTVRELSGEERDRVYAEHARRFPAFAEYEQKTAGIRTIPVLELRRA